MSLRLHWTLGLLFILWWVTLPVSRIWFHPLSLLGDALCSKGSLFSCMLCRHPPCAAITGLRVPPGHYRVMCVLCFILGCPHEYVSPSLPRRDPAASVTGRPGDRQGPQSEKDALSVSLPPCRSQNQPDDSLSHPFPWYSEAHIIFYAF